MTITLATLRAEFPVTEKAAYLNHASYGPFSRRTSRAVAAVVEAFTYPAASGLEGYGEATTEARENIAALVGGDPERVAFVGSLADAMSLCATGIAWANGDNVLLIRDEFPSNVYAFLNLARHGVQVRLIEKGADGFTSLERVADAIDTRTRALVISHVEFMTGFRNDLTAIGRLCREHGVLSIVDATQSMGALPIDVSASGIDVIAAHGYKWLMASFGIAPMHFSEQAIEAIHPSYVGRLSVNTDSQNLDYQLDWRSGAARYQTGGMNWLGLAALNGSAELIRQVGPAATEKHTLALTEHLLDEVARLGYQVTSSRAPEHRSQIVSFTSGDRQGDAKLVDDLAAQQVVVALRGKGVRVSPYFYNSTEDVDRLLAALPRR